MTVTEPFTVETVTERQIAKTIDHSLLKPELTVADVLAGCDVAAALRRRLGVLPAARRRALPRRPRRHRRARRHRHRLPPRRQPDGDQGVRGRAGDRAGRGRARHGPRHRHAALRRADATSQDDIAAVVEAAGAGAIVKVILENAYLTDDEKVAGCRLGEEAGAALRQDVDRLRPVGRHPRRPAPDAGHRVAARSRSRRPAACARSTPSSTASTPASTAAAPRRRRRSSTTCGPARAG